MIVASVSRRSSRERLEARAVWRGARWLHALMIAVLLLGGAAGATAQEPEEMRIRRALRDADRDGAPDRIGTRVALVGVVTSDAIFIGRNAIIANLQDASGRGITLFTRDTTLLTGSGKVVRGDSLRVHGVVGQYRGAEQLRVERVERLGRGTVPAPRDVLAAELMAERFAGALVRAGGTLEVERDTAGYLHAAIRDRTGVIPVHVFEGWLSDPQFVERLLRGGTAEVVGVLGQQADGPPFDSGYRVYPRTPADFGFPPVFPYRALTLAGLLLLAVGLGWARQRAARRAREMARLAEELQRSRDALQESEQRFRSLVENSADAFVIIDAGGVIRFHSPALELLLGRSADELTGMDALEHVHPDDLGRVAAALHDVVADPGGARRTEFRFRHADGTWRILQVVGKNRTHDGAVRGVVCNVRDVSEQRALEERLRQSDRLETVGRLAGGIAHDFNNVLTAVSGHARLILDELPPDHPQRTDALEIERAAARAASLTRQLLAFSRKQILQPRVIEPLGVVRGVETMLRRLIGEDIDLIVEQGAAGRILADVGQLEQVLVNLAVNARDAMPGGGRLSIEIGAVDAGSEPGGWVRLRVSDTGVGMDEATRARIFEPFFTTKEQGKGTGLGLATVYGIVKQSGGHVSVRSAPGRGTTFEILLPRVDMEPQPVESGHDGVPVAGSGETVLLVEDDDGVRTLARRILERGGFRVLEAAGPADALDRVIPAHTGTIHALVTDVVMPEMGGRELAERVAEVVPGIRTVFMSGYNEDEVLRRGIQTASSRFVEKPFTAAQLLGALHEALASVPA